MTLKIEAGKKYRTRGGDEVEILRTDVQAIQPVVGIKTYDDGSQVVRQWHTDGSYWVERNKSENDLISEVKPKRTVWVNVYLDDSCGYCYDSRAEADANASDRRIACIQVTFEEGQFDE